MGGRQAARSGRRGFVCTSVCTLPKASDIEAAIANVTRLLARTDDATTAADLVTERASLREELRAMRGGEAGVIRLQDERARRNPRK